LPSSASAPKAKPEQNTKRRDLSTAAFCFVHIHFCNHCPPIHKESVQGSRVIRQENVIALAIIRQESVILILKSQRLFDIIHTYEVNYA
jgi:hypothetical protein